MRIVCSCFEDKPKWTFHHSSFCTSALDLLLSRYLSVILSSKIPSFTNTFNQASDEHFNSGWHLFEQRSRLLRSSTFVGVMKLRPCWIAYRRTWLHHPHKSIGEPEFKLSVHIVQKASMALNSKTIFTNMVLQP